MKPRCTARRQVPAQQPGPLTEPGQPRTAHRGRWRVEREPACLVSHLDRDSVAAVVKSNRSCRAPRVPDRVRQALLHDPITGKLDGVGQRPGLPVDQQLGAQARLPGPLDQRPDVIQARLRGRPLVRLVLAEPPDKRVELGEPVTGALLDGRYGEPPACGSSVEANLAAPACTAKALSWWATTSWTSRASTPAPARRPAWPGS